MAQRSEWLVGKSEVSSDTGVVATMVRQASEAGADMLVIVGLRKGPP